MGLAWSQSKQQAAIPRDPAYAVPPEVFIHILTYLQLEDLPNVACVSKSWNAAIKSNYLWMQMATLKCPPLRGWIKHRNIKMGMDMNWRTIFRQLQACVYVFNKNMALGIESIVSDFYVPPGPENIIRFLTSTKGLNRVKVAIYVLRNRDTTKLFIDQFSLKNVPLADALRSLFDHLAVPPGYAANQLHHMLELFADRYIESNSHLSFTKDSIFFLCFSLLMLSSDLTAPQVRNKLSKREFVRLNRSHLDGHDDYLGRLYDNVYLFGHIAHGHHAASQASQRIFSTVLRVH
eukprot:m.118098 g.118098  ORF g.118098 m.118098 type:complete len:291 (+) comp16113_c1_seq9:364-1236(+)